MPKRPKVTAGRLTKDLIDKLKPLPKKKETILYDTEVPHLVVVVTPKGKKTFQIRRWFNGSVAGLRLGCWPETTVSAARIRARAANVEFDAGRHPGQEKRKEREAAKQAEREAVSLNDLWNQFLTRHLTPHRRPKTVLDYQNTYKNHLEAKLGKLPASQITRDDVAKIAAKIGAKHPIMANRVLALLSSIYERGAEFGLVSNNPTKNIRRYREESRDRFLNQDELQRLFEALSAEPNNTAKDFFLIALLTGARRSNCLSMAWKDIDFQAGTWRIPETKGGRPHVVYLPPPAIEILLQRRQEAKTSFFVFPANSRTGHMVEPIKAWRRVCRRAGLVNVRIHDLRRTLGSFMAITGAGLPVIGKALNHTNQSTTAIYARLTLDPVREAVDRATAAMVKAVNGDKIAKIGG